MRKYKHELTKELTPDNWKEKLNLSALDVDDIVELLYDMRKMEGLGKKIGGFLKEVLRARTDDEDYAGRMFDVLFKDGYREGNLDVDLITEEMGEEWVENHRKSGTDFVTIKLEEKEEA